MWQETPTSEVAIYLPSGNGRAKQNKKAQKTQLYAYYNHT